MKKVAVFIGTRPEAIKMAPVIKALENSKELTPIVISTGQHREMLDQVIDIFDLNIDHDLNVMQHNQTLPSLTSRLIQNFDSLLKNIEPDCSLIQGDTTTVMTAALSSFYRQIPVGHVEAGLRTNNIYSPFPEEINRRLATTLSTFHFAPTEISKNNLLRENVSEKDIFVTGNTVIDALFIEINRQKEDNISKKIIFDMSKILPEKWNFTPYVLITGHRRENFGQGFNNICKALTLLAEIYPNYLFIYPVHLNPNVQKPVKTLLSNIDNIVLIPPLDYSSFVYLMNNARLVLTDSGGIQEEAPSLGKPVLVMRDTTERPEGIDANTVKLVGTDPYSIVQNVRSLIEDDSIYREMSQANNPYGDGKSAINIVSHIENSLLN
jgi:UDP-N-acetylglucosamine 2-epimerase (non-hydrolysing)